LRAIVTQQLDSAVDIWNNARGLSAADAAGSVTRLDFLFDEPADVGRVSASRVASPEADLARTTAIRIEMGSARTTFAALFLDDASSGSLGLGSGAGQPRSGRSSTCGQRQKDARGGWSLYSRDVHVASVLRMGDARETYFEQYRFGKAGRFVSGDYALVAGQEDPRT
jgi:hypothetical protein